MRARGRGGKTTIAETQFIVSLQVPMTINEGAAAATTELNIPVSRAGNMGFGGTVDWAVTPTGTNPATTADFGGAFPSGTLTFSDTEFIKNIVLTIYGNNTIDNDRTFLVTLSNATTTGGSGLAVISIPSVVCTLIDDDVVGGGGGATYQGNDAIYYGEAATYGET